MRRCLRCESAMVEDLNVMVTNNGVGIDIREKGLFKGSLSKIKCAVCPRCGYVETYVENLEPFKQLIQK